MKAFAVFVVICGIASSAPTSDVGDECEKVPANIAKPMVICDYPIPTLNLRKVSESCGKECPNRDDKCCLFKCLDKTMGWLAEKIDKEAFLRAFQEYYYVDLKAWDAWNSTVGEGIDKCVTECKCAIIQVKSFY